MKFRPATVALIAFVILAALRPIPAEAQRHLMTPIEISPGRLMEAYQNDFHQADALYTGKLLLVTGRIVRIKGPSQRTYNYQNDKLYAFLTLDTGRNLPLAVYFWDWEAEKINALRVGSTVSVMGFCQGVPPQLSLREACVYPEGCGGPRRDFYGPYFKTPASPQPQRRN